MECVKISDMGSFYVGGKKIRIEGGEPLCVKLVEGWKEPKMFNPDGDYQAGQMYVRFTRLAEPDSPYPICMIHGGGLCGAMWERTLDGQPGWEMQFLRNGYNVNISDGADRGRSSWAKFPEINKCQPFFRSYNEAWKTFRLGEEYPVPYEGLRFDLSRLDDFMKQQVPRFPASTEAADAAYSEYFSLLESEGGYIVMAYSEGGLFALRAALKHPEQVKAIILIESTSTLDVDETDVSPLKNIPFLHIWGDYVGDEYATDEYAWAADYAYADTMKRLHERILGLGGDSTWVHLPEVGIKNNSHALIVENNSKDIANIVIEWLHERNL